MTSSTRHRLALASYWFAFIIVPAVVLLLLLGPSATSAGIAFGLAVLLMLIGERGFRHFRRLWRLDKD
jgi:hypothetical protein